MKRFSSGTLITDNCTGPHPGANKTHPKLKGATLSYSCGCVREFESKEKASEYLDLIVSVPA